MGRPPKPVELKRLQGFPGHHPRPAPTLAAGRIGADDPLKPPGYLTASQRKAWRELASPLQVAGFLDYVDVGLLEAAAICMARAREAGAVIEAEGLFKTNGHGLGPHPAVTIERESWKEFRMLADRLGIGPSARARLGSGKSEAESLGDELDRTLGIPARLAIVAD